MAIGQPVQRAKVARVDLAFLREYVGKMPEAHYREAGAARSRDDRPQIDWDRLTLIEAQGWLLCVGATIGEDLVGYSVSTISRDLTAMQWLVCQNLGLYVQPEYRSNGVGKSLIEHTETLARHEGADEMRWHAASGSNLDRILHAHDSYRAQGIIHVRRL